MVCSDLIIKPRLDLALLLLCNKALVSVCRRVQTLVWDLNVSLSGLCILDTPLTAEHMRAVVPSSFSFNNIKRPRPGIVAELLLNRNSL